MEAQRLKDLLERYLQKTATAAEREELFAMARSSEDDVVEKVAAQMDIRAIPPMPLPQDVSDEILQAILLTSPARRVHFLRRGWVRYAAAIILIAGAATAIVVTSGRQSGKTADVSRNSMAVDILPGTNRAVLTVDNKQIDLASDKTGITVGKTIAYTNGEKLSEAGKMLMLTTPNGGQYQLVLPDGTKAWLNAASAISFPSTFEGGKRQIKVSGEVYLEVAKDKAHPFLVDVDGQSTIEVLGTSFNVNAYDDETAIKTTLIDGSVRVGTSRGTLTNNVILKPGEQARQPASAEIAVQSADLSQALAWKNGLFNFNGLTVREVLHQLARWYDIKVRIQGKEPEFRFMGEMYRSATFPEVLKMLQKMEVRYRMEGKTLIVL